MKNFSDYERTYQIRFSDGRKYGFATDDEKLYKWMDDFVDMIHMQEYSGGELDGTYIFSTLNAPRNNNNSDRFPGYNNLLSTDYINFWNKSDSCFKVIVELNNNLLNHCGMDYMNMSHCLKIINKHYFENGGGVLHAAFAGLGGQAILIAAPGNTGKTTSLSRLPEYWEKLSDDIVLMVLTEGGYQVHPMPTWSDYFIHQRKSTRDVAYSLPLDAVFFLEKSNYDQVTRLEPQNAVLEIMKNFQENLERFIFISDSKEWNRINHLLLETSMKLAGEIPCFRLKATLQGQFWKEMERVL